MADVKRRLAITRKLSLAAYGDDLSDCYVVITLIGFAERASLRDKWSADWVDDEATKFMIEVNKRHFVSGKIRILNEDGTSDLVDMQVGDLSASEEIISAIYLTIMGVSLDPKAMRTLLETSPTSTATEDLSSSESSTKTSSSKE